MEQQPASLPRVPSAAGGSALAAAGRETIAELVVAPLWWYTGGLARVTGWWLAQLREGAKRLSLRVLISHWLQPMYGQYDAAGRIISFVIRTVVLVWHVLMMNVWFVIVTAALLVYILLPAVATWGLIASLA